MTVLTAVFRWILILTMLVMVGSVALGVISRYVVGQPLFWTDEAARFALVWMTFVGAAALLASRDGHIRVDLVVSYLSKRLARLFGVVSDLIVLFLMLLVLAGSILWISISMRHYSPAMSVPMPLVYAVLPLSASIASFLVARRIVRALRGSGN
ncbi:TRAP transporter small permease [Microbaculum marinum]|uniref:TRAP transporter small permease protein n=1 Tax=Microbaculum marinum TaxID=1764581 RepID=A0AAW9RMW2_9HYPH